MRPTLGTPSAAPDHMKMRTGPTLEISCISYISQAMGSVQYDIGIMNRPLSQTFGDSAVNQGVCKGFFCLFFVAKVM